MAKRVFSVPTFTPTAQADGALTNATYMALLPGSSTQVVNISKIYMGGVGAAATAPMLMQFARSSTIATTPTALALPATDGPSHGATAALAAPVVPFTAAATGPNRSAATTVARLAIPFNSYGGTAQWQANDWSEYWTMVGTAANVSESHLSQFTGGSNQAIGASITYEPM